MAQRVFSVTIRDILGTAITFWVATVITSMPSVFAKRIRRDSVWHDRSSSSRAGERVLAQVVTDPRHRLEAEDKTSEERSTAKNIDGA
jgi:hypothetical protein